MVIQAHRPKISFNLKPLILLLCIGVTMNVKAQRSLPDDEVEALKQIAAELRKTDWTSDEDPYCSNGTKLTLGRPTTYHNSIKCKCAYPGGVCHVVGLHLEGQDLSGVLPTSLVKLPHITEMFLTSNLLNGTVPDWIKRRDPHQNVFESFSGQDSSAGQCSKNLPCPKDWNSVHINCGGNEVSIGNIKYEADLDESGAANFHRTRENWGISSTGNFWESLCHNIFGLLQPIAT